jgi:cell division protein FtsQ
MKKVLYIILAILLLIYLGASVYYFTYKKSGDTVCEKVEVVVADSLEKQFLTGRDIVTYLTQEKLYPLHKKSEEVNTYQIEEALLKNVIIASAEVVQSVSGKVTITVTQIMPVLRVYSTSGNYYVDNKGQVVPSTLRQAIYVPVASGNIEKSFAISELYKFALFLQNDAFWNDQITQVYVRSVNDVEIVPRVGNHRILMGSLDDFETKLAKLRMYYEQVIPKAGWDKYSIINLKYKNQIVCTKNNK